MFPLFFFFYDCGRLPFPVQNSPCPTNEWRKNYLYLMVNLSVMQWAEVLSADAFSAFEDAGLDNDKVYFFLFLGRWWGTVQGLAFVFNVQNPLFSMFTVPYITYTLLSVNYHFVP